MSGWHAGTDGGKIDISDPMIERLKSECNAPAYFFFWRVDYILGIFYGSCLTYAGR